MKQLVTLFQRAGNAIAVRGEALINHKLENHLRWSLVPDKSPEESQWHGADPYITSMFNQQVE